MAEKKQNTKSVPETKEQVKELMKQKKDFFKEVLPNGNFTMTLEEAQISPEVLENVIKKGRESEAKQKKFKENKKEIFENDKKEKVAFEKYSFNENNAFDEIIEIKEESNDAQIFKLPSGGKGYENPILRRGFISVFPMTGLDEERLLNMQNSTDIVKSFNNFLNIKIAEKEVDVRELYIQQDFYPLITFLKIISSEPNSDIGTITVTCPACGAKNEIKEFSIKETDVKTIKEDEDIPRKIKFSDGTIIYIGCLSFRDSELIEKAVKHDNTVEIIKKLEIDTTRIREWQFRTRKIFDKNGKIITPEYWFNFYLNMTKENKIAFINELDKLDSIGNHTVKHLCSSCNRRVDFRLQLGSAILFK